MNHEAKECNAQHADTIGSMATIIDNETNTTFSVNY